MLEQHALLGAEILAALLHGVAPLQAFQRGVVVAAQDVAFPVDDLDSAQVVVTRRDQT